ncbi:phosphatidylserine decarboxylase [Candidatus Clavichlamydia salmonicola]|uniref:phosphatidylserine decarboxylase n=1 Tax=Candidatus Clavichlamydia salmonicola TaxID=469812 RepID=UPI001E487E64|nr:phosphatidylserine decarboxylase [Candidatus Clavichlamydia salmonicola]
MSKKFYPVYYIDRLSGELRIEKIYSERSMRFCYGQKWSTNLVAVLAGVSWRWLCSLYGTWQKLPFTRYKIASFVKKYDINVNESTLLPSQYKSFNHFFTRKLKKSQRPIAPGGADLFVAPVDGRFLVYPDGSQMDDLLIKGRKFSLKNFLGDEKLAEEFSDGSILVARLAPVDYHRFHFMCDCIPEKSYLIQGDLHSIHPWAIKNYFEVFTMNKRAITVLNNEVCGKVLFIEVGALNVGSIKQTYKPGQFYSKGEEKGYFSFGGSTVVALFKKNTIFFDKDLVENSLKKIETLCFMGQSLGKVISK